MTCAVVGSLAVRGVTFLDMPLVTRETVKGVQVRQRTKPACSAKQLHRPRAVMAARSYGPGRIGVAHDTISSSPLRCGARVLPWSGRELNFWQYFVALGNCTGNHGSVSWLPTIKCAGEHYGASNSPPLFTCPNCKALYQCVKIEAGPETADNELRCQVCSGPLVAREGKFVLKYYLLREAIRRERRKWRSGRTKID